jgi:hypothetical protein
VPVPSVDNAMWKCKVLGMLYTGVEVYSVNDKEEGEKVRDEMVDR